MKAEDLILDHSSEWEEVKELSKVLPDISISVLSLALIIETIHLSNLSAFVVASQNGNPISVPNLHRNQERHSFD